MSDQEIASELKALEAARVREPDNSASWIIKVLVAAAVFAIALIISDFVADKTIDPTTATTPQMERGAVLQNYQRVNSRKPNIGINPEGQPIQYVKAPRMVNEMPPTTPPSPR